jgi:hypothetical protein
MIAALSSKAMRQHLADFKHTVSAESDAAWALVLLEMW